MHDPHPPHDRLIASRPVRQRRLLTICALTLALALGACTTVDDEPIAAPAPLVAAASTGEPADGGPDDRTGDFLSVPLEAELPQHEIDGPADEPTDRAEDDPRQQDRPGGEPDSPIPTDDPDPTEPDDPTGEPAPDPEPNPADPEPDPSEGDPEPAPTGDPEGEPPGDYDFHVHPISLLVSQGCRDQADFPRIFQQGEAAIIADTFGRTPTVSSLFSADIWVPINGGPKNPQLELGTGQNHLTRLLSPTAGEATGHQVALQVNGFVSGGIEIRWTASTTGFGQLRSPRFFPLDDSSSPCWVELNTAVVRLTPTT